jgi:F-type H+-transporting ATPase subunit b
MGPEFWVAISFLLFVALLVYLGLPGKLANALDDRAASIRNEIADARRLRDEAQAMLSEYRRRRDDVSRETEEIIAMARKEARFYAEETRRALTEQLARRAKSAEEKIARAEAQALAEIRSKAVDAAIAAAQGLIAERLSASKTDELIVASVEQVKSKLN